MDQGPVSVATTAADAEVNVFRKVPMVDMKRGKLHESAVAMLLADPSCRCGTLGILGDQKTGKSWLQNYIAGIENLFPVNNGEPLTKDVDLGILEMDQLNLKWDSVTSEVGMKLCVLDAEGTGDRGDAIDRRNGLFSLLQCRAVMYNFKKLPRKNDMLQKLSYYAQLASVLKEERKSDKVFQKPFGHLHIVCRDVPANVSSATEYKRLFDVEGSSGTDDDDDDVTAGRHTRNGMREQINKAFESVTLHLLPMPALHVDTLVALPFADVVAPFRSAVRTLVSRIVPHACDTPSLKVGDAALPFTCGALQAFSQSIVAQLCTDSKVIRLVQATGNIAVVHLESEAAQIVANATSELLTILSALDIDTVSHDAAVAALDSHIDSLVQKIEAAIIPGTKTSVQSAIADQRARLLERRDAPLRDFVAKAVDSAWDMMEHAMDQCGQAWLTADGTLATPAAAPTALLTMLLAHSLKFSNRLAALKYPVDERSKLQARADARAHDHAKYHSHTLKVIRQEQEILKLRKDSEATRKRLDEEFKKRDEEQKKHKEHLEKIRKQFGEKTSIFDRIMRGYLTNAFPCKWAISGDEIAKNCSSGSFITSEQMNCKGFQFYFKLYPGGNGKGGNVYKSDKLYSPADPILDVFTLPSEHYVVKAFSYEIKLNNGKYIGDLEFVTLGLQKFDWSLHTKHNMGVYCGGHVCSLSLDEARKTGVVIEFGVTSNPEYELLTNNF